MTQLSSLTLPWWFEFGIIKTEIVQDQEDAFETVLLVYFLFLFLFLSSFFFKWEQKGKEICSNLHHRHLSLNREGRWGTIDDFATSCLHFPLFFTALWDIANARLVHSLMLSSQLFLCLPCLLPPFTAPFRMVLARPDELEAWQCHCSLRLFTIVRRFSCGPTACWILARISSLAKRSLYEMRCIVR